MTRICVDCNKQPAMPRKGRSGPHPKRCESCTAERHKSVRHNPKTRRADRPACCQSGVCNQHKEYRAVDNVFKLRAHEDRLNPVEADFLADLFAKGFHVEQRLKGGNAGPYEGRTFPDVFHANPFNDLDAELWYETNKGWEKLTPIMEDEI